MKIAQINMLANGSTGKIMFQIAESARTSGHIVRTYAPVPFVRGKKNDLKQIADHFWWGNRAEACFHYYFGTLLGWNGLFSYFGTQQLIHDLKKFSPDIIHLHNLHGFCINLPLLFRYIKKTGVKVIWTFHDCWAFTGHCPYFTLAKCSRWETTCCHCPQPKIYPKMYCDTSKMMYRKKKKWFSGIRDLTIVTPSEWLAELTAHSFLKDYHTVVIRNGIDLSVFKPTPSGFREKHGISACKHLILGVAFDWGFRKGLDVFIELSKRLNRNQFQIVLVGTNEKTDKQLPDNIISIHRTQNQTELAEIYTAADLFVNPTREENYPTVNMESIACGTPVLTFKTGGSPEMLTDKTGAVVDCDDIDTMAKEIIRMCNERPFSQEDCTECAQLFDMNVKFKEYVRLYGDCTHRSDRTV